MSRTREQLKIVLLQFRDDEEEKGIEKASFARVFGIEERQLIVHDGLASSPSTSLLDGCHMLVIGGSKLSVFETVPHMEALTALLQAAREKKLPTLGICFGAQLLAHVFGGQVVRDVEHAEYGTFAITGTDDAMFDMIFADAQDNFMVQQAHRDAITKLPPSGVLLASSTRCKVQAFMIPGADIYAFQFHPERSKEDYGRLLDLRKAAAGGANAEKFDAIKAGLKDSVEIEDIIAKFIDRIVIQKR